MTKQQNINRALRQAKQYWRNMPDEPPKLGYPVSCVRGEFKSDYADFNDYLDQELDSFLIRCVECGTTTKTLTKQTHYVVGEVYDDYGDKSGYHAYKITDWFCPKHKGLTRAQAKKEYLSKFPK